jgi:hypothetical protein
LLALLVAAHRRLHAHLAERVELVDEHDAGRLGLGLPEQVAHARGAHAHEHLDELRSAQAEEGHLGLARDGPRQQGLAGAGRADEQHALRDAPADARVLLGVLEELDDLLQLLLGLVHAGDVPEAHLDVVLGVNLGAAARERHHAALRAAHAPEEEAPDEHEEEQREHPADELAHPGARRLAAVRDAVLLEVVHELRVLDAQGGEVRAARFGALEGAGDLVGADRDLGDAARPDERLELAVGDRPAGLRRRENPLGDRQQHEEPRGVPQRGRRRPGARAPIGPRAARVGGLGIRHDVLLALALGSRRVELVEQAFMACSAPPRRGEPCSTCGARRRLA